MGHPIVERVFKSPSKQSPANRRNRW